MCVCSYINMHTYLFMYTYLCICICLCVYIYMYIYLYNIYAYIQQDAGLDLLEQIESVPSSEQVCKHTYIFIQHLLNLLPPVLVLRSQEGRWARAAGCTRHSDHAFCASSGAKLYFWYKTPFWIEFWIGLLKESV